MRNSLFLILLCLLAGSCGQGTKKEVNLMDSTDTDASEKLSPISPDTQAMKKFTRVEMITDMGRLEVALFDCTPKHRDNFIKLVKSGYYNGTLFHRIIADFMVQGGDPDSKGAPRNKPLGSGGPGYKIPAEITDTLYHYRGALAAAREDDGVNPSRASSGSQFYIVQGSKWDKAKWVDVLKQSAFELFQSNPENLSYQMRFESYQRKKDEAGMAQLRGEVETEVGKISDSMYNAIPGRVKQMYGTWGGSPFLDKNYTVFGFLVSGYDVLEKLNKVETLGDKAGNRPVADVKIISARVMN